MTETAQDDRGGSGDRTGGMVRILRCAQDDRDALGTEGALDDREAMDDRGRI